MEPPIHLDKLDRDLTQPIASNSAFRKQINSIYLRVPPLNKEFEPTTELKNLRKAPVEKRARALSEFKSKLASQTEAVAYLRVLLEEIFSNHQDSTQEEMLQILDEVGSKYGLITEIKSKYAKIIEKAFKEKENIKKLNDSFSNKEELFELVTKTKLQHPDLLRVEINPFSLIFYVSDQDIESFKKFKDRKPAGFHNISNFLDIIQAPIPYTVIFYDPNKSDEKEFQKLVLEHETEHSKDRLFNERLSPESKVPLGIICLLLDNLNLKINDLVVNNDKLNENLSTTSQKEVEDTISYLSEKIAESKSKIISVIENYILQNEAFITDFARNELVAQKKESVIKFSASEIAFKYDFSGMEPIKQRLLNIGMMEFRDLYIKIVKFQHKVNSNFVRASEAFDNLLEKGKFTKEEAISLLTFTPLQFWPKEVERILEKRRKALKKTYPLNS